MALTDAQLVRYARRLQRLHQKAHAVLTEMAMADADGASRDLTDQCFGLAWPEHVIGHHLADPDRWETGVFGIRVKGRSK